MAPLPHGVAHKHHLSFHSLVSMTTLMAPTHHHTAPSLSTLPYLSHPVQGHLRKIYTGLCGESQFVSRARLAAFLADVQGQPIELPEDVEEYTFEDWLALLWMKGALEGVGKLEGKKDLGFPMSSYYISSSHNTYLSGNQLMSKSTTDAYKTVSLPARFGVLVGGGNGLIGANGYRSSFAVADASKSMCTMASLCRPPLAALTSRAPPRPSSPSLPSWQRKSTRASIRLSTKRSSAL